jgi:RNA polymerase sigma-70 factor (ECF subfamily)
LFERMLDVFLASVPHAADADQGAIAQCLSDLYAEGQASWPALALGQEAFARHLGTVTKGEGDVLAALGKVHGADFYLACACVFGVAGASRAFADAYLGQVATYVGQIDARPAFDDVRQELSRKLLLAEPDEVPKLALYNGRGALGAFVRVTATRVAKNMLRGKTIDRLDTAKAGQQAAKDLDPEVVLLKKRFSAEFTQAFDATMAVLSREERNVLKLHYLSGLSIEQVGEACNVSRATAARWLAKARSRIVQLTYKSFADAAGPNSASPESMLALVKSELGSTVARYFDSEAAPEEP